MLNSQIQSHEQPRNTWQAELGRAITTLDELCHRLNLPSTVANAGRLAEQGFPLLVPEAFLRRIEPGDLADPLLRQVLPRNEETRFVPGFTVDPLGEGLTPEKNTKATQCPAMLTKYHGRSLLLASQNCGIHCRFCFRRHRLRQRDIAGEDFSRLLQPVLADPSISEVILSGGDPLWHDDATIDRLLHCITNIAHVKSRVIRIRIHSRLPVVIPSRWTPELLEILHCKLPVLVVLHVNHPRELDETRFAELPKPPNLQLLSQTVLLAGVNDDEDVLCQLFERLVDVGILPYYLHQLDRVTGAAEFEVSAEKGRELMERLRCRLPGYAVPRYVCEEPGSPYKRNI